MFRLRGLFGSFEAGRGPAAAKNAPGNKACFVSALDTRTQFLARMGTSGGMCESYGR